MKIIKVVRNINRGGFGDIDEVICNDGFHYARKMFSPAPQFLSDTKLCSRLKKRFVREVKTQQRLPHEYFIPILYENLNTTVPYFIMPIAEAVYTEEIEECKNDKRNPNGLGDILNALEFLHDIGLVHRDLKPQNILKHNGVWKLADFGLISQDKEILSQTITTSKQAFGTAMYCPPEQATEFSRITPQADIYSFGAILHDIFSDDNRVPYSELSAEGDIGQVIQKCTRRKKELRFKSIKSLRSKVLSILSKKTGKTTDEEKEWQDKFKNIGTWDEDTFESFIFYLNRNESFADLIFHELTEEHLTTLNSINKYHFNDLAIIYCKWVYQKSFGFDYCDVVVTNIYSFYNASTDIEVKSNCAISAAELGKSHNRWYVMGYVVKMCNPSIDKKLAFRIGMDIGFESRDKQNFLRCVEGISLTVNSYHDLIKENLE